MIASKYDGKCKDCGTQYEAGVMIDTNGKQSPNKYGEMKDHWCRNGKNCQGAMQLTGTAKPSQSLDEMKADFLRDNADHTNTISQGELAAKHIIALYIGVKTECKRNNIEEPPVVGMIFNNVVRRLG